MARENYSTQGAPAAVGPYSQAVQTGEFMDLSGQTAQDPANGQMIEGDVEAQSERAFQNLEAVLRAAGKTLGDVVKIRVFLTSMADFTAMNAMYARIFSAPYPARTTVAAAELPLGAKVEIDLVAR